MCRNQYEGPTLNPPCLSFLTVHRHPGRQPESSGLGNDSSKRTPTVPRCHMRPLWGHRGHLAPVHFPVPRSDEQRRDLNWIQTLKPSWCRVPQSVGPQARGRFEGFLFKMLTPRPSSDPMELKIPQHGSHCMGWNEGPCLTSLLSQVQQGAVS